MRIYMIIDCDLVTVSSSSKNAPANADQPVGHSVTTRSERSPVSPIPWIWNAIWSGECVSLFSGIFCLPLERRDLARCEQNMRRSKQRTENELSGSGENHKCLDSINRAWLLLSLFFSFLFLDRSFFLYAAKESQEMTKE